MLTRTIWLGAALILSSTVGQSQKPMTLAQAAHQFQFGTIPERIKAFYAFDRVPGSWTQPGAAHALLALLEREDAVITAVIRESGGRLGAGDKYGEDYGEYDGQVSLRCAKYCDQEALLTHLLSNIRDVPELRRDALDFLGSTYDDPRLSLAQRARINSAFVAASRDSTSFLMRAEALRTIGIAMRSGHTSTADRVQLHSAMAAAASDPNLDVRLGVVRLVSELHDPSDSSLLRRMSIADTAQRLTEGKVVYPVRDAARAALATLRKPTQ